MRSRMHPFIWAKRMIRWSMYERPIPYIRKWSLRKDNHTYFYPTMEHLVLLATTPQKMLIAMKQQQNSQSIRFPWSNLGSSLSIIKLSGMGVVPIGLLRAFDGPWWPIYWPNTCNGGPLLRPRTFMDGMSFAESHSHAKISSLLPTVMIVHAREQTGWMKTIIITEKVVRNTARLVLPDRRGSSVEISRKVVFMLIFEWDTTWLGIHTNSQKIWLIYL